MTILEIAETIELPKTQVEHYFRTDKNRSIPSPEIWKKLKELLGIATVIEGEGGYKPKTSAERIRSDLSDEGGLPELQAELAQIQAELAQGVNVEGGVGTTGEEIVEPITPDFVSTKGSYYIPPVGGVGFTDKWHRLKGQR